LKIKEAVRVRDENLFERSELFSSVVGCSVVFSQGFIVSLDFFGLFFHQGKNEQANNQQIIKSCYIELT